MNNSLTINDIKDLFILRRVSGDQAMEVFRECPVIEMDKGETLIRAGQSNQKLYIILEGALTVHLDSPESDPVAVLNIGETVGELSVIDDSPASASWWQRSHPGYWRWTRPRSGGSFPPPTPLPATCSCSWRTG